MHTKRTGPALAGLLAILGTGCAVPSEEIGATIGDTQGEQATDSDGEAPTGSGTGEGDDVSTAMSTSAGDATDTETGSDASSGTAGEVDACWDAWTDPSPQVDAATRPDPATSPGMRLDFDYGDGVVVLTTISDEQIVQPSDDPLSPRTHSGTWVELRDAADQVLYTRNQFELVPESAEVAGPLGNVPVCPEEGFIRLQNVPNTASATEVVFFQEPIDGELTFETIELMRFALP